MTVIYILKNALIKNRVVWLNMLGGHCLEMVPKLSPDGGKEGCLKQQNGCPEQREMKR